MIKFIDFTNEDTGIHFQSLFPSPKIVTVSVSDGYTGLNLWKDKITIHPETYYYFSADIYSSERQFEIFDEDENQKIFSIFIKLNDSPSIEELDTLNILKSYKYHIKERGVGLPVFEIFLNKEYENKDIKVQKDDIVFDIGANIGIFSLYSLYNQAKEVHSFEPGIEQFSAMQSNLCSKFPNLYVNNLAVTKNKSVTKFYTTDSSVQNSLISHSIPFNNYKEVNTIDIETYVNEHNIQKIDYLKIDCEGGEYEIIEHINKDFLQSKVDKIVLEYHHFKDKDKLKSEQLINKLISCNFTVEIKGNMIYCKNLSLLKY